MRYVIFADVHGDKDALERLLSRHRGNPYISLGDLYWMLTPDAVIEEMTMAAIKKGVLLIEGDHERDNKTEFKLQSVLDGELGIEDDESYWYPLWPDRPGGHPWE